MFARITLGALLVVFLGSCDSPSGSGGPGFQSEYSSAREALEDGRYASASRKYGRMVQKYGDGPAGARLRLELSHAMLRSGAYTQAASVARVVSRGTTGRAQYMALAVLGTAEHQAARERLARGENDAETASRFKAAAAALDAFLAEDHDLDLGGAMERRRALLRSEMR